VLNHNTETVPRLYKVARHGGRYERTLELFRRARADAPSLATKSGIIVGLGETADELIDTMRDLRAVDVDILTLGQYLQPTLRHLPVVEFVSPSKFDELGRRAREMGFVHVASGPRVRSSYHADEFSRPSRAGNSPAPLLHENVNRRHQDSGGNQKRDDRDD
jgi:lipoic acid synthetase